MAARINHSSNLREITPCNSHGAGFVISARSVVKLAASRAALYISAPSTRFGLAGNDGKSNVSINWRRADFPPFFTGFRAGRVCTRRSLHRSARSPRKFTLLRLRYAAISGEPRRAERERKENAALAMVKRKGRYRISRELYMYLRLIPRCLYTRER